DRVDFGAAKRKWELLARARDRMDRRLREAFNQFRERNEEWLEDYALFMAIRDRTRGPWQQWPRELVVRKPRALAEVKRELAEDVERHRFGQFVFYRQLDALRAYARSRGVRFIGDLPIFVSAESAD